MHQTKQLQTLLTSPSFCRLLCPRCRCTYTACDARRLKRIAAPANSVWDSCIDVVAGETCSATCATGTCTSHTSSHKLRFVTLLPQFTHCPFPSRLYTTPLLHTLATACYVLHSGLCIRITWLETHKQRERGSDLKRSFCDLHCNT